MSVARLLAAVWVYGAVSVICGQGVYNAQFTFCGFDDDQCTTPTEHGYVNTYFEVFEEYTVSYLNSTCLQYTLKGTCQQLKEELQLQFDVCDEDIATDESNSNFATLSSCTDLLVATTQAQSQELVSDVETCFYNDSTCTLPLPQDDKLTGLNYVQLASGLVSRQEDAQIVDGNCLKFKSNVPCDVFESTANMTQCSALGKMHISVIELKGWRESDVDGCSGEPSNTTFIDFFQGSCKKFTEHVFAETNTCLRERRRTRRDHLVDNFFDEIAKIEYFFDFYRQTMITCREIIYPGMYHAPTCNKIGALKSTLASTTLAANSSSNDSDNNGEDNDDDDDFPVWAILLISIGVPLTCVLALLGYKKYYTKSALVTSSRFTSLL